MYLNSMTTGGSRGEVPERTTTVLLADDHSFVRETVKSLLEAERGFRVIGETGNGLDAARMLKSLQPNVAVIDITMPGMNGLDIARQTVDGSLNTSVVIYSLYESKAYVLEAMRAGAKACVSKTSSLDELVLAIREVAAGGTYFSRPSPNTPRGRDQRRRIHWRDRPGE